MRRFVVCAALAALAFVPAAAAESSPSTLIVALDGVPYFAVRAAFDEGAFEGWAQPRPMVSTFPSMTNIAYTAMFEPSGTEPIEGYERRYYDEDERKIVSGIGGHGFPWRDRFDLISMSLVEHANAYLRPKKSTWNMLRRAERALLEQPGRPLLVHVGGTDALGHFKGGARLTPFLVELSARLEEMARRHERATGRPVRFVLFSDHGNSDGKLRYVSGVRKSLKRELDLRFRKKRSGPRDAVAPTFGLVGYGIVHVADELAEPVARVVVRNDAVDLAAWISGERRLTVVNGEGGRAVVSWRDGPAGRRFRYEAEAGDPLQLAGVLARIERDGEGFAPEAAWFRQTVWTPYPDGPRRLVDSLTGTYVRNSATVIYSTKPGWGLGLRSARWIARLRAFKGLCGTHGGLDAVSTLGFVATSGRWRDGSEAYPARRALEESLPKAALNTVSGAR